jgi:hypothetical protein
MISTEVSSLATHYNTHDRESAIQKHKGTCVANIPCRLLRARRGKPQERCVKVVPRRIASVESDYVSVVKNMLKKELKTACAARLRFYQDKELNVTTELVQVAEHNDHP